jgi:hypothetical protein
MMTSCPSSVDFSREPRSPANLGLSAVTPGVDIAGLQPQIKTGRGFSGIALHLTT